VSDDRLLAAIEALVLKNLPALRYVGTWDYKVTVASPGPPVTVEATSVDPSMPPISGVPVRPGADGGFAVPSPGDVVSVAFANPLNPQLRRPYIVSLDPSNIPLKATLDAKAEVDIGASAPLTAIGAAPTPVALSTPTIAAQAVIAGALASIGTLLVTPPTSTVFATFAAAAGPILEAIAAALAVPTALIPTKTTTAT
jgi:hypothetical protein